MSRGGGAGFGRAVAPTAARRIAGSAAQTPAHDELLAARIHAAAEAERLEDPPRFEADRRDLLDDLASRLDALARQLERSGADATTLCAIVRLLRDETLSTTQRCERARTMLRAFSHADEPATSRAFWKTR